MIINLTINTSTNEVNVSIPREYVRYDIMEIINDKLLVVITPILDRLDKILEKAIANGKKN